MEENSLVTDIIYCDICEGIESNLEGEAPYVDGGVYCDC